MLTERLGGLGFPFNDGLRQVSTVANELHILRNRWVHYDPLSDLDALRTADHVARLLTLLGDADGAAEAKTRRTELLTAYATEHGIAAPAPISEVTTEPVSTPTPRSVPVEAPGPRATASATATPSASRNPNSDHVSPSPRRPATYERHRGVRHRHRPDHLAGVPPRRLGRRPPLRAHQPGGDRQRLADHRRTVSACLR